MISLDYVVSQFINRVSYRKPRAQARELIIGKKMKINNETAAKYLYMLPQKMQQNLVVKGKKTSLIAKI